MPGDALHFTRGVDNEERCILQAISVMGLSLRDQGFVFLRLPQTGLRLLGLPGFETMHIVQIPSDRYQDTKNGVSQRQFENEYFQFNKTGLRGITKRISWAKDLDEILRELDEPRCVIDLNLVDHVPITSLGNRAFEVIDYASSTYCPIWTDVWDNPIGFARAARRSAILSNKIKVSKFWDWSLISWKSRQNYVKPWFWESKNLDALNFSENLKIFIDNIKDLSSLFSLSSSMKHSCVLITNSWRPDELKVQLDLLYETNTRFKLYVDSSRPIFIKNRRSHFDLIQSGRLLKYRGAEVLQAKSVFDLLVPSELFYLDNFSAEKSLVFSELGSSNINPFATGLIGVPSNIDNHQLREHGFQIERMRRICPNFIW